MEAEVILLFIAVIMMVSAILTKVCFRIGIPTLVLFLTLGMIIGADGIFGFYFDDASVAMLIGVFALSFIVFNGGLTTKLSDAKPVLVKALLLASVGVVITAVVTGLLAIHYLKFSLFEGLLLGAIVSSTDAAATFSILRSKGLNLKNNIGTLLEIESGSNDPFSYMLTIIMVSVLSAKDSSALSMTPFIIMFVQQIVIGAVFGVVLGLLVPIIINKINLNSVSIYPMFTVALALTIFSLVSVIGGNGLLAIYIAGLIIGNKSFIHKLPLIKFFESQTWIMQVLLFVMLGLLVFPKELPGVAHEGILVAIFITFVARPIAVFSILSFFKVPIKDMILISWAGLRGAASMVFAIFPLIAKIDIGTRIFNIVFFIAVISILIQGGLLPLVAKWLDLTTSYNDVVTVQNFSRYIDEMQDSLMDVEVLPNTFAINKSLTQLAMPETIRIIRIKRGSKLINPNGNTHIHAGDRLLIIVHDLDSTVKVRGLFEEPKALSV